jgi:acyl-CoA synthetase (AMP-forming)/AMP-acid ligase II
MTGSAGVAEVVRKLARAGRDRVAVVDGVTGETRTVAELDGRRRRLANVLRARGCEEGDRVAVLLHNGVHAAEVLYGIATAGLVQVNVNDTLTPHEIAHILTNSGARVALVAGSLQTTLDVTEVVIDRIVVGGNDDELEALLGNATADDTAVEVDLDAPAVLIYTSGTTGRPKGVTLTHRNVLESAINFLIECFGPDARTYLACIPYFHVACVPNLAALLRGMTVVVSGFDADLVADLIERHQVTHVPMPPTAVSLVLDADAARRRDLSSLRRVLYAGSPMPEPVLRRAIDRLGPILEQAYGMTETAGLITILRAHDHDLSDPDRLASCGREITRTFVDIVDLEGVPVSDGTPGELVVRGPNVMVGYWGDPDATALARFGDAFRTGDVGVRDLDGFISVVGRIKDLIITGANNVYPVEVEKALEDHPSIREVAVIGMPHPTWGETVAAVVVSDGPIELEVVRSWCARRLAIYKQPRLVFQVPVLPRNAIGKVDKPALREALSDSVQIQP